LKSIEDKSELQSAYKAKYYAKTSLFSINEVEIDFSYGYIGGVRGTIPYFEMYYVSILDGGENIREDIRQCREEFLADKYLIGEHYGHTETLRLPANLFMEDFGRILFRITGWSDVEKAKTVMEAEVSIYYAKVGDTVYLSNSEMTEI
jgi:hypothetical protein